MSDPTGPDLLDEQMDRRLQEYGARWRAALPEPSATMPVTARPPRRWLAPAAAAAAVVVLLGVTYAVTSSSKDSPGPASGPTPSVASDDTCRPGDLVVADRELGGALGTATLNVHLRLAAGADSCLSNDFPHVELLDHGTVVPVRVTHRGLDANGTTVFAADTPVGVSLTWEPSHYCGGTPIDNDVVRISVGTAQVEVEGFGQTFCSPGEGTPPVRVLPFLQVRSTPGRADTAVTGTVTMDGGPSGASTLVTSGTVELVGDASGDATTIGPDGRFRVDVPPGLYQVTVTTPQWNDGAPYDAAKLRVTRGGPMRLDIHIPIR